MSKSKDVKKVIFAIAGEICLSVLLLTGCNTSEQVEEKVEEVQGGEIQEDVVEETELAQEEQETEETVKEPTLDEVLFGEQDYAVVITKFNKKKPNKRTVIEKYDDLGRLIINYIDYDSEYKTVDKFDYDDNGNMITDLGYWDDQPSESMHYEYDENNNVVHEYDDFYDGAERYYENEYDENGNLIKSTVEGEFNFYEYDDNGNLIKKVVFYTYDDKIGECAHEYSVTYDSQGNMTSENSYDLCKKGALSNPDRTNYTAVNGSTWDISIIETERTWDFVYNDDGLVTNITYNSFAKSSEDKFDINYEYNENGQVIKAIIIKGDKESDYYEITYDDEGRIVNRTNYIDTSESTLYPFFPKDWEDLDYDTIDYEYFD